MEKIAIVTGASSGIGLQTCKKLVNNGYQVVAVSRKASRCNELIRDSSIKTYDIDLTNENQVYDFINDVYERYEKIDVLVNNAGIGLIKTLDETSLEEFKQQFESNIVTMFLVTKKIVEKKPENSFLHIVNISSEAGVEGFATYSAYCASKFAVTGFSESIKEELREKNVKVDIVCPGDVNTPFMDKNPIDKNLMDNYSIDVLEREEMLKPEDIAELIMKLLNLPKNIEMNKQKILPGDSFY